MLNRPKLFAIVAVAGIAVALANPTPATATIVFDNFGPGNTYIGNNGWSEGGTPPCCHFITGFRFSPSTSGFFSQLTIALNSLGTPPTPSEVNLYQNNPIGGPGEPGTILETLNFTISTQFDGNINPATVVAANGSTFLDSSLLYWLVPNFPTGDDFVWNYNSVGDTGFAAQTNTGANGPWVIFGDALRGAFRIEVADAVPEPSTLGLIGLGLLGLGAMRRRRKLDAKNFATAHV